MRRLLVAALALLALGGSLGTAEAAGGVPNLSGRHVYLIIGENREVTQINKSSAPYLNSIRSSGAWLTNYFAITHFSEANYVGMMSGQFTHCQQFDYSAAQCHQNVDNLFHQLDGAGVSWQSWLESMPNPCDLNSSGSARDLNHYGAKHNPVIFFDNVEGAGGLWSATAKSQECLNHDITATDYTQSPTGANNMGVFNAAVQSGSTAQFNLVVPNECEDGHDNCQPQGNGVAQFDSFLRTEVPIIQGADPNALILITYDEGTSNKGPADSKQFSGGGNVVFLALGNGVSPGTYTQASNHYGLLRTLENGYNLSALAGAGTAAPIDEIWSP